MLRQLSILPTMDEITQKSKKITFSSRFYGFYRALVGVKNAPATQFSELSKNNNHIGIYDVLTLGIPSLIESLARGNFISSFKARRAIQIILAPVWIPLNLVRAAFGLVGIILGIIPLAIYHACRMEKYKPITPTTTHALIDKWAKKINADQYLQVKRINIAEEGLIPNWQYKSVKPKFFARWNAEKSDAIFSPENIDLATLPIDHQSFNRTDNNVNDCLWKRQAVKDNNDKEYIAYIPGNRN